MNEEIQKALIELERSLNELDDAAKIIRKTEKTSGELIHSVSATINKVKDQHDIFKKSMDEWSSKLKKDSSKILDSYEEIVLNHAKTVNALFENYQQLASETDKLVKYLNSVNFAARLDKIDATIASVNSGIQNLSTQIADAKREINKELDDLNKQIKTITATANSIDHRLKVVTKQNEDNFNTLNQNLEEYNKKNNITTIIIIILITLTLIVSITNIFF